ncbi:SDR family NAD(P)-dependent oxidoreductase [Granulicoccus phenolivorans]|uniref:SDR family NAD(P)-dependent oxidoreductase n=1 Tax=Granulicoccus phenolivorans TaxID=266854 RepID=UPI00040CA400|nr:SDR family oxidoreductase [Granulicoccus phenolivorans]
MSIVDAALAGRVAIVTGAGAGNGAAIAERLAAAGAAVVCADLNGEAATSTADRIRESGGRASAVTMDHTSLEDCRRTADQALAVFGAIDVLVNNAGIARVGVAHEVRAESMRKQLDVNVLGPMLMSQAVLPTMMAARRGSIVMIASLAALYAKPGQMPYVVSKHALLGLTRSIAVDYGRHGVRCNAVCPAFIRTEMTEKYLDHLEKTSDSTREEVVADLTRDIPLGRLGVPADVAEVVLHLASDASAWTTGEYYRLDGGEWAGR